MRRSFRVGLRIGLLVGIVFALVKTVQSRRSADRSPAPEPWQPIVDTPRPRPEPDAVREPAVVAREREAARKRPVDEVGEPIQEPPPADDPGRTLTMPEVPPPVPAHVREEIVDPEPVAKLEPLDVLPESEKTSAPVKKAASKASTAGTRASKAPAKKASASSSFVEPIGGVCPPSHQVKAKLGSRLFHLPGMFAYDRTRPDRCYLSAAAAEADGFTRARR